MNLKALFLIVAALFFVDSANACRRIVLPIYRPDPAEYLLFGSVKGYEEANLPAEASAAIFDGRNGFGIVIEVSESIHTPLPVKKVYEVFPIGNGSDCRFAGLSRNEIEKQFPIGSKVRVIAHEALYFKNASKSGQIRLETLSFSTSGIWLNTDSNGNPSVTKKSVFDYSGASYSSEKGIEVLRLAFFEARKDLWRLLKSKTQEERNQILDRLIAFPPDASFFIDFNRLLKVFTSSDSEYTHYSELRDQKLKALNTQ